MRRNDKAVLDRDTIDTIIHQSDYCHLACCQGKTPYVIPVSFGYDGTAVYIHTASSGRKIGIFEHNSRVCLAFVSRADLISNPNNACDWSYEFSSVIAEGTITKISEPEQKNYALNQIMIHYSGKEWDIPEKSLAGTLTWKITIDMVTGKNSPPPKKPA
jgi:hypothetical protein